ncbi:MAG: Ig-like domain-containing protein [Luteolibacter sp.]
MGSPTTGNANWRIDDLTFKTSSAGGSDIVPPAVSLLSPPDDATGVLVGSNLIVTFSENVAVIPATTGKIELRRTSDNSLVEEFPIASGAVTGFGSNTLSINPTADLAFATGFYVIIPAGFVEDAVGNDFPGLLTTTAWSFTTEAVPLPPIAVINKIFNSGGNNGAGDSIELLVTGNGTPGTVADLSGLYLKDFSSSITSDGGGQYQFLTGSIWNAVPVGTLIVLTRAGTSSDVSSADFSLVVDLDDPTYFAKTGGTLDLSSREMVMLKTAASGPSLSGGSIHAMAVTDGNPAPTFFDSAVPPKLISATTLGSNAGVIANNPTSAIGDFNGASASTVAMTVSALGVPNNTENLVYINALRGIVPGDGSGQASLINATVGPFSGLTMFDDAQVNNQTVKISLTAQVPSVTLTTVEITVPTGMGVPSGATVTGAGAGTPSVSISSQVVTISGLAVTNTNLIDITLNGLDTPVTTAADNGNQTFTVKTAIAAGTLKSILTQPVAHVIIPIEAIRDVNVTTGVPMDINTVVAVEGVCTEAQVFNTNTLAFIQDGDFGVGAFNSGTNTPFNAGDRFAVVGRVSQFSGLTQVAYSSNSDVVNLGVATSPTPLVITIPDLLLNPEAYEGRLITVNNLSPAVWSAPIFPAASVSVAMMDNATPTSNPLTILITSGSGASTGPGGAANITGIYFQTDISSPFTAGYQLLPREADDVDPLVSGFGAWIASFYGMETDVNIVGFAADPDLDGIPNGVEALIGGVPNAPGVFATSELIKTGSIFSFLYPQDSVIPVGIQPIYQWSTDMVNWRNDGGSFGGITVTLADELWDDSDSQITIYRVTATVTVGTASKLFVRVGAVD